jgi:hypothetical protein
VATLQLEGKAHHAIMALMMQERTLLQTHSQHDADLSTTGDCEAVAEQIHTLRTKLAGLTSQIESGQVRRFCPPFISPRLSFRRLTR